MAASYQSVEIEAQSGTFFQVDQETRYQKRKFVALALGLVAVVGIMGMIDVFSTPGKVEPTVAATHLAALPPAPVPAEDLELSFNDALSADDTSKTEMWGFKKAYKSAKDHAAKAVHSTGGAIKKEAVNTAHNIQKDANKVKDFVTALGPKLCNKALTTAMNFIGKEFKHGVSTACMEMCASGASEVLVVGAGNPLAAGVSTAIAAYCTKKCKSALMQILTTGHLDVNSMINDIKDDATSYAKDIGENIPTSAEGLKDLEHNAELYAESKANSYLSKATDGMFTDIPTTLDQAKTEAETAIQSKGLAKWTEITGLPGVPETEDQLQDMIKSLVKKEAESKADALTGGVISGLSSSQDTSGLFAAWGGDDLATKLCSAIGIK